MQLTATIEDIQAYIEKVEKNEITPETLPACAVCGLDACHFKLHAFRERRFLIIVDMQVQPQYAPLVRFRCPGCNKTVCFYPDFSLPHKHYTRQSIMAFAERYVASDTATYQQAVWIEEEQSVPGYASGESLSPSTIHRWITRLSCLPHTARKALNLICQDDPGAMVCRVLAQLSIAGHKFRTRARKERLLGCLRLLTIEAFFKATFHLSIFTKLATNDRFT
jgi:hypothetical protein